MAEKSSSKKPRSYWSYSIRKTRQEIELAQIISEGICGGIVTVFFAWMLGFSNRSELPELLFLCVGGAIIGAVVGFLIRLLFITPAKLYKEHQELLANNERKEILSRCLQKLLDLQSKSSNPPNVNFFRTIAEIKKELEEKIGSETAIYFSAAGADIKPDYNAKAPPDMVFHWKYIETHIIALKTLLEKHL